MPVSSPSRSPLRKGGSPIAEVSVDLAEHRALLEDARARTVAQLTGLTRDFDAFVDGAEFVNTDDEHDPEGQTIAFERAQVISLRREADDRLDQIDVALSSIEEGTYGRCRSCGGPIDVDRLRALPSVRRCIGCAESEPAR